jgi:hypothetical protein
VDIVEAAEKFGIDSDEFKNVRVAYLQLEPVVHLPMPAHLTFARHKMDRVVGGGASELSGTARLCVWRLRKSSPKWLRTTPWPPRTRALRDSVVAFSFTSFFCFCRVLVCAGKTWSSLSVPLGRRGVASVFRRTFGAQSHWSAGCPASPPRS